MIRGSWAAAEVVAAPSRCGERLIRHHLRLRLLFIAFVALLLSFITFNRSLQAGLFCSQVSSPQTRRNFINLVISRSCRLSDPHLNIISQDSRSTADSSLNLHTLHLRNITIIEMSASPSSSPSSFTSRRASRTGTPLSLDLSNIPPLSQPSPPSNTLLITDLHNLKTFQPDSLAHIKSRITEVAPLNSFSPLPSLRRIVCSLHTIDAAVQVRQLLEQNSSVLGDKVRAKIYFGEHTPVEDVEEVKKRKLLEAPHAEKLFFISPPPSPPHGWMLRNEDPPNKEVHAADLSEALSRLGRSSSSPVLPETPGSMFDSPMPDASQDSGSKPSSRTITSMSGKRSRSSTLIYHPEDHGSSPHLPAVMVEDTTIEPDVSDDLEMDITSVEGSRRILAHTPRPPVELIQ